MATPACLLEGLHVIVPLDDGVGHGGRGREPGGVGGGGEREMLGSKNKEKFAYEEPSSLQSAP